ncbi:MAG TPA: hypothetical protein VKZ66_03035 [Pusillimonas sp.]|uniref:hypothetical protein n=1 Tax=unclassified Pusillimonas TaxID=2640016 RepID=UPI00262A3F95|nr:MULTISPECIES: hypothetical protein [unclassified Pusillimonas]HLU18909.1 hypothetical protein [Pusillimonas sp.]
MPRLVLVMWVLALSGVSVVMPEAARVSSMCVVVLMHAMSLSLKLPLRIVIMPVPFGFKATARFFVSRVAVWVVSWRLVPVLIPGLVSVVVVAVPTGVAALVASVKAAVRAAMSTVVHAVMSAGRHTEGDAQDQQHA